MLFGRGRKLFGLRPLPLDTAKCAEIGAKGNSVWTIQPARDRIQKSHETGESDSENEIRTHT